MSKYELALVVNAKIEDEAREAVVEKAKSYVARYGGTVTEVEEWGKKRLAYEVQKMREGFYYLKSSDINNNLIESFNKTFKAWYKCKKGFNCFE